MTRLGVERFGLILGVALASTGLGFVALAGGRTPTMMAGLEDCTLLGACIVALGRTVGSATIGQSLSLAVIGLTAVSSAWLVWHRSLTWIGAAHLEDVMSWVQLAAIVLLAALAVLTLLGGVQATRESFTRRLYVSAGVVLLALALFQAGPFAGGQPRGIADVVQGAMYFPTLLAFGTLGMLLGSSWPPERDGVAWVLLPVAFIAGTAMLATSFQVASSPLAAIGSLLVLPGLAVATYWGGKKV